MGTPVPLKSPDAVSRRYESLLAVAESICSHSNASELFAELSERLRPVVNFDAIAVALHDAEHDLMRLHLFESHIPLQHYPATGEGGPVAMSPEGVVWQTQQPILISPVKGETRFPEYIAQIQAENINTLYSIPLTSSGRRLGAIAFGSIQEKAYDEADREFLRHVAKQVAVAIDNVLNLQSATDERDRNQLLLQINNAVVSTLDLKVLVKAISASLQEIMPHDAAGIALYDPEHNLLREYSNVSYREVNAFREGDTIPIDGTPAGEVFVTGEPMLIRRPNPAAYPADRYSQMQDEGSPKSACLALLVSHGRKLGILGVSSTQIDKFSEHDLVMFSQISGQIALAVENSLQYREIEALKNRLAGEKLYLEEEIKTRYNFSEIVGQSSALREVLRQVETVAPTDSTVLLIGETGTGKELIARAIHNLSTRNERTLVKLNCAAIPTGLLESELFGHEKGAFTGAIASRLGRFELANKGTLLLDEIGEIPLELQPKLLRVLQEHEFERLGSSRTIKTDARLIAATNCDLAQMVEDKTFRRDLFYRLNVFPIIIPPLRERAGDIPLLVGYFTQKHAARMNKKILTVPAQTMEALSNHHWPGNVRELENFVERSVILSRGAELQTPLSELESSTSSSSDGQAGPAVRSLTTMDEMERAYIEEVLRHTNGAIGGKGGAAEILGLPASTLRGRMKKLGFR